MTSEPDDIVKLPKSDQHGASSLRLESVSKKKSNDLADSIAKKQAPQLKVVEEAIEQDSEPIDAAATETEREYKAFEGKSIEANIDAIINKEEIDPDANEKAWGTRSNHKLPIGWTTLIATLICASVYYIIQSYKENELSDVQLQNEVKQKLQVVDFETNIAENVLTDIKKCVFHYLAASTIDEKLKYSRPDKDLKAKMEQYYKNHDLVPKKCDEIIHYQPLALKDCNVWKVMAKTGENEGEVVIVAQNEKNEVSVDWESHVLYQPMDWEDYISKKPSVSMEFRVNVYPESRYLGEYSSESRWSCYRLTVKDNEKSLYGYVLRDSQVFIDIEESLKNHPNEMIILRLRSNPLIRVKDSVSIEKVISSSIYRADTN